jgi:5-methylcytosine-specific restriction endonuclease McrA
VANSHHTGAWYRRLWREMRQREPLICGLCDRAIDKQLQHPHRGSYTLDMVIPRSRGGQKTVSNYQPAHRWCNISKLNGRSTRVASMTITDEDEP